MKISLPAPINDTQREFAHLCQLAGGTGGGPSKSLVLQLLRESGKRLNSGAYTEIAQHFASYPAANPWHICFAVGLAWGHLAKFEVDFTGAVVGLLENWNRADLASARSFHLERGPDPIEQSLRGVKQLFDAVRLPEELPKTLDGLGRAQERWLNPILSGNRPRYIGSWNATAMFMSALFAQPILAAQQVKPPPILPPGGPIQSGLAILHRAGLLSRAPSGSALDDAAFEPGALYENNALLAELEAGLSDWSLIDVHSGVYMLGTRDPHSANWI